MKTIHWFIFFIGTFLLSGCMKEDYEWCPDENNDPNLILYYTYMDPEGKKTFTDCIQKTDVVIFDDEFRLLTYFAQTEEQWGEINGARLRLDPGDYYIVGWGNIGSNSRINNLEAGTLFESALLQHTSTTTIDPLYYAPDKRSSSTASYEAYRVSVKENGITEHTLPFMSAFRTINIFITGLGDTESANFIQPIAQVNYLPRAYNFNLGYSSEKEDGINFTQETKAIEIENKKMVYASFYVPHFNNENNILVGVSSMDPNLNFVETIGLEEFLRKENITVTDGDSLEINIQFDFMNGTLVSVQLAPFKVTDVGPSFD